MESPLDAVFGNRTAGRLLLYLFHHGEAYARGVSRDLEISLSSVQRQLERFEGAGLLVSRRVGNTRLYTFDPRHPASGPLQDLVRVYYEALTIRERERLFPTRRRPRRKGKPVLGRRE
jgi:DNA-binding transcriptional ArsR family regulator